MTKLNWFIDHFLFNDFVYAENIMYNIDGIEWIDFYK